MSDKHTHSHGDGHDHDHDHDHEHGHSHEHVEKAGDPQIILGGGARPPATPPPAEVSLDDAGTQALSEALRSSFLIVRVIMGVLVVLFFSSGIFTIKPEEKGVIFHFGKPQGTGEEQLLSPGLHWSWPSPIDEVRRIPIGQLQTVTSSVGWFAEVPGNDAPAMPSLNPANQGYVITSDRNILHVKATLRYRVSDPISYSFNFASASNLVQNALDNAVVFAASRFTADNALRLDTIRFREMVVARVGETVSAEKLGIRLEPMDIVVVAPPFVRIAFEAVTAAEADRNSAIARAHGEASSITNRAQGEATQILNSGKAERSQLLSAVAGEASRFNARLPEYRKNPDLFRQRMLAAAMQSALTNAQEKFFLPEAVGGDRPEIRLLLNREPAKGAGTPGGP